MRTIFKYPLAIIAEQEIEMPDSANMLTVQMQNGKPYLWAHVDTLLPMVVRKVSIRGTGHPADNLGRYISTFQMANDTLVFHVFEAL